MSGTLTAIAPFMARLIQQYKKNREIHTEEDVENKETMEPVQTIRTKGNQNNVPSFFGYRKNR